MADEKRKEEEAKNHAIADEKRKEEEAKKHAAEADGNMAGTAPGAETAPPKIEVGTEGFVKPETTVTQYSSSGVTGGDAKAATVPTDDTPGDTEDHKGPVTVVENHPKGQKYAASSKNKALMALFG